MIKLKIFSTAFFLLTFTAMGIAQNKKKIINVLTLKVDSFKTQNEALFIEKNKQNIYLKQLKDTLVKQSTEIYSLRKYIDSLTIETQKKIKPLEVLKQKKIVIDSFMVRNLKNCIVLVKLINQTELLKIVNENWPDTEKIETTFNVFKDNYGKIVSVREIPQSQSGDWGEMRTHYFSEDGKTFAFARNMNEYNSGCAEISYETRIEYFNIEFNSIGNDYELIDEKGKDLRGKDCDGHDYKCEISSILNNYLRINNISVE